MTHGVKIEYCVITILLFVTSDSSKLSIHKSFGECVSLNFTGAHLFKLFAQHACATGAQLACHKKKVVQTQLLVTARSRRNRCDEQMESILEKKLNNNQKKKKRQYPNPTQAEKQEDCLCCGCVNDDSRRLILCEWKEHNGEKVAEK